MGFRYPVWWHMAFDTVDELADEQGWVDALSRWRRYSSPSGAVPNFGDTSGWTAVQADAGGVVHLGDNTQAETGDVVYALPVLHAIRRHRPRAEIWWLVTPACSAVLPARPVLDGVIHFDRDRLGRCLYDAHAAAELMRLLLLTRQRSSWG